MQVDNLVPDQLGPDRQVGDDRGFGAADAEQFAFVESAHGAGNQQQQPAAAVHVAPVDQLGHVAERCRSWSRFGRHACNLEGRAASGASGT